MAKKVVTLFIDDFNIRLLVAKGKKVQKWAHLPLEPGLVKDGVITDEAQMVDKLKEFFKLTNISPSQVIAGLSGLNSLYRLITLPELPEAVRDEAVRHEARRVIPVSLEQVHLAYQILAMGKGEIRLFLTAYPRNAADILLKTLRQAGVEPYLMDLAPLALCRNVSEPRAIIVNVWSTNIDIIVMADRLPQVIRSLSIPGEASNISEALPAITEEVERTVAFYNSSHQENPLNAEVPLLVSGDLAEAPESWPSLAGRGSFPVSVLTSPMELPEGFDPSPFMVNLGLALKELQPETWEANFSLINFNALPRAKAPKARPKVSVFIPIAIAAVGIAALVYFVPIVRNNIAVTANLRGQLTIAQNLITQQQQQITALKEEMAQLPPPEPLEATAAAFETTYATLGEERERADGDMRQIVGLMPGTVDLTEVSHAGDNITIGGEAPNEVDIFTYARSLRSCGRFSLVVITSITEKIEVIVDEETEEEEEIKNYEFSFLLR